VVWLPQGIHSNSSVTFLINRETQLKGGNLIDLLDLSAHFEKISLRIFKVGEEHVPGAVDGLVRPPASPLRHRNERWPPTTQRAAEDRRRHIETSFGEAIRIAKEQKSVSLEKRAGGMEQRLSSMGKRRMINRPNVSLTEGTSTRYAG
jgi:hypothetical protein